MEDKRKSNYSAHYNPVTNQYQSNYAHLSETAEIVIQKNPIPFLENIIWLRCRPISYFLTKLWYIYP